MSVAVFTSKSSHLSFNKLRWRRSWQLTVTVLCSAVFVMFLFAFPVFCFSNTISFTRNELLNIRQNTPQNLLTDFDYSDVLLDIVFSGAAVLFRRYRMCRRGKRAGALVKLHQRVLRTALPSIHLVNLRSLTNKTDKLLLSRTNKGFSISAALCFTESWLNDAIPDSVLHLPNFQLIRADQIIFQCFCFSLERFERHYELQDTIPSTLENQQLADDLNDFYCRFVKTPHTRPEHLSTQPLTINTSSNPPIPHTCTEKKWIWHAPGLVCVNNSSSV